ncbi:MAG: pilus assembly protein TadG-related protein [Thermodesulfovibrionales bacterium]
MKEVLKSREGASALTVALLLFLLVGVAALAIDTGHLAMVANELQNAADAGALAGALYLYNQDGTVNNGADAEAIEIATENKSDGTAAEVDAGDVERGTGALPRRPLLPTTLRRRWSSGMYPQRSWMPTWISSMRCGWRRGGAGTQAASYLARIFGYDGFSSTRNAVAYIGFAGTLKPGEADQPIAICKESLLDANGKYVCSRGRMINSAPGGYDQETAGWTNFEQPTGDSCGGAASSSDVRKLICKGGNPKTIKYGEPITTAGGEQASSLSDLITCWKSDTSIDTNSDGTPDMPWKLTLVVVECNDSNPGPCNKVVGAVTVDVLWITDSGSDPHLNRVPRKMEDWTCPRTKSGQTCWNEFVEKYTLRDKDGNPAPYTMMNMYLKPDCETHEPAGRTGGENFGVLSKIPVLVK